MDPSAIWSKLFDHLFLDGIGGFVSDLAEQSELTFAFMVFNIIGVVLKNLVVSNVWLSSVVWRFAILRANRQLEWFGRRM